MSQPVQQPPQQPVVRLQTWVNVVLVLILFASCSANNNTTVSSPNESEIASQVVSQLQNQNGGATPSGPASAAEVEDLCRLLGAVAAKQGVRLTVMNPDELTRCHEVAQEAGAKP